MAGYTKLWSTIVRSTVWQEPLHVKVTWVTMLALSDARGYVGASIPGLANAAGVTIPQCEEALQKFLSPDIYSRTKEHEGRRIIEEDGGWLLLTYEKHRAGIDEEERRIQNREAQQRHRDKISRLADSQQNKRRSPQAVSRKQSAVSNKQLTPTTNGAGGFNAEQMKGTAYSFFAQLRGLRSEVRTPTGSRWEIPKGELEALPTAVRSAVHAVGGLSAIANVSGDGERVLRAQFATSYISALADGVSSP